MMLRNLFHCLRQPSLPFDSRHTVARTVSIQSLTASQETAIRDLPNTLPTSSPKPNFTSKDAATEKLPHSAARERVKERASRHFT
jgi:hypothetical protein